MEKKSSKQTSVEAVVKAHPKETISEDTKPIEVVEEKPNKASAKLDSELYLVYDKSTGLYLKTAEKTSETTTATTWVEKVEDAGVFKKAKASKIIELHPEEERLQLVLSDDRKIGDEKWAERYSKKNLIDNLNSIKKYLPKEANTTWVEIQDIISNL